MSVIEDHRFAECLPGLNKVAVALTRDRDWAADLVQDSVERAIRKAHLFDGTNLQGWLNTICRRLFINQVRRRKAQGVSTELDSAPPATISFKPSQETNMFLRNVIEAYAHLSESDQAIIHLVVLEGFSYNEIAHALDIPIGTVRSRLSRARMRLAKETMVWDVRH